MKIKRFFAKDMRQAIRMVREDQGDDAVILSSQKKADGVEVVIAIDYDEAVVEAALKDERVVVRGRDESVEPAIADDNVSIKSTALDTMEDMPIERPVRSSASQISWSQDPAIVEMQHEVKALRGLLENQMAHLAWGEMSRKNPNRAELLRRLNQMGVQSDLCEELVADVAQVNDVERAWRRLLGHLGQRIQVTDDDILNHGGVVALVGPTGIGKTTTIAKLAARYALRHGARSVALISTDNYRIGAHEQLLTYGRILGIPVQVAAGRQELADAIENMVDKRLILIDTAGMSQRDLRLSEQFDTLQAEGVAIRTYLTLSATTQTPVVEEAVKAFSNIPIEGCIITKMDESMVLGGILSVVARHHLPVAYIGDGQRVPEDIHQARADKLVSHAASLMKEMNESSWNYEIAERLGGMVADIQETHV
ncbi:MAG: flagellar biosynthesis protein FlhF [Gammaproteobacteria bacterium]|nr:flagellar biosynthesis protein FlhF [Gammaproteobacteria bacterium]